MSYWFGSPRQLETTAMRKAGLHVTSRVRCAARFAKLTGSTIYEASKVFEINVGGVWLAWERMYPDAPHPRRLGRRIPVDTFDDDAPVAQRKERLLYKRRVTGSNPVRGT